MGFPVLVLFAVDSYCLRVDGACARKRWPGARQSPAWCLFLTLRQLELLYILEGKKNPNLTQIGPFLSFEVSKFYLVSFPSKKK